ncbi:hypothetical protein NDU88_005580 [Pleurodeles waltl]|uniref:Uncharacterized protein n=1 Tax=Pleurodeles waltl TaxID=8319 RepID=A0AAV7SM46_PLEWA|nr:hypothetical protein NDU88_005580 [Pleurodeles waltl]
MREHPCNAHGTAPSTSKCLLRGARDGVSARQAGYFKRGLRSIPDAIRAIHGPPFAAVGVSISSIRRDANTEAEGVTLERHCPTSEDTVRPDIFTWNFNRYPAGKSRANRSRELHFLPHFPSSRELFVYAQVHISMRTTRLVIRDLKRLIVPRTIEGPQWRGPGAHGSRLCLKPATEAQGCATVQRSEWLLSAGAH